MSSLPLVGIRALWRLVAPRSEPLERVAVVVAHPDDEIVGAGGHLGHLRRALFIYVTDGAPRDGMDAQRGGFCRVTDYALARRRERDAALALVGVDQGQVCDLAVADQEASLQMVSLTRRILALLTRARPLVVITMAYEGGHPDHDATALAVHGACRMMVEAPTLVEMTSYHAGASGMEAGVFLPDPGCPEVIGPLSRGEMELKKRLMGCHATQRETLAPLCGPIERFRLAPAYDFTRPPHEGLLFYDRFPWGMRGSRFRRLAAGAWGELAL